MPSENYVEVLLNTIFNNILLFTILLIALIVLLIYFFMKWNPFNIVKRYPKFLTSITLILITITAGIYLFIIKPLLFVSPNTISSSSSSWTNFFSKPIVEAFLSYLFKLLYIINFKYLNIKYNIM